MTLLSLRQGKNDLARLHRDMDDLVSSFFGGWPALAEKTVWPAIDISEDENTLTVKAEVPGCNAEDIDISVQGNTLTISGEKKHEEEKKEKGYYYAERNYGSFRRDLSLPSDIDPSKIDAACKNGVLTIKLPKSERAKAVKVKVKGQ
ncbi:MAG: Hsp20/alpha crystallin family protein [Sedimentisphaerales bacterium]|nr:Hsp20/alpha crystallin family protein [Sedimentisphaerales bacterium]